MEVSHKFTIPFGNVIGNDYLCIVLQRLGQKPEKMEGQSKVIEIMEMTNEQKAQAWFEEWVKGFTIFNHGPVFTKYDAIAFAAFCLDKREEEMIPLNETNAWDTISVISKLAEAADILLHKKDYDGHGWEEIGIAQKRGLEILKQLRKS